MLYVKCLSRIFVQITLVLWIIIIPLWINKLRVFIIIRISNLFNLKCILWTFNIISILTSYCAIIISLSPEEFAIICCKFVLLKYYLAVFANNPFNYKIRRWLQILTFTLYNSSCCITLKLLKNNLNFLLLFKIIASPLIHN